MMAFNLLFLFACLTHPQEGFTEQGGYYVTFETNPSPIPFNEYFDVTVGVFESKAQTTLVSTVDVLVDATMPTHEHGMNVAPVHTVNDDGYTIASGLEWFMIGSWQLAVYITPQDGGLTETAYFSIECCKQ